MRERRRQEPQDCRAKCWRESPPVNRTTRYPLVALTAALLLVPLASTRGESPDNGIEFPAKWPPQRTTTQLRGRAALCVPFLEQPPAVIPIDVGRQLFADDFLVEKTTFTRQFHRPQRYEGKAPLKPAAKRVRFQMLVDRSSVELFADQGQATIPRVMFSDPNDDRLSLTTEGDDIRVISLQVNRLESI